MISASPFLPARGKVRQIFSEFLHSDTGETDRLKETAETVTHGY